ncbi:GNAT family N-acetyltransferase [Novacetimonas pomaceti]|uniref:GNAT family N-acetyltransferase n=1 Tax=Novacetimonas pomaceti TaxID=2021998 RepID=A0A318QIM5_9PROT|nr:GNAT family N-acetyltransferase [Novacetimonas pomaceti]MBV1834685.1 GNAT family N-acetyltransferase [Novacetimonas pomaceti]PYD47643.1 GNAT family N-acetyltransferase [Novacetimonas pomaceti]PYD77198.1 GNAT family N-acetyltransferase [Novacetimonas pomaceti]
MTRVAVDVTFLCMDREPPGNVPPLPEGYEIRREIHPAVSLYRDLYNRVGQDYCWWLRRVMGDAQLAQLLENPAIGVYVLRCDGEVAGFFELDGRQCPDINLAYFGLLPRWIGRGIGLAFLHAAIHIAWRNGPAALRVNTCSADHPRALPNYVRAGFRAVRVLREVWDIPDHIGLSIPKNLCVPAISHI